MSSAVSREILRKVVHIGFGAFAFTLGLLSTWQAAAVALSALVFNTFVLPHVGGRRIARTGRGTDLGIVLYPLAVLVLILSFHDRPALAAVCWIILAFGDGMATLAGQTIRTASLPWNPEKSWGGFAAFLLSAFPVALLGWWVVAGEPPDVRILVILAVTVVAAAVSESLRLRLDDNIVVPVVSGLTIALLATFEHLPAVRLDSTVSAWLVVNAVLAVVGHLARSVSISGMIAGFALGSILILFAGWQLYVVLLIFFVVGSGVTKLGYRRKEAMGLAQEEGGRRGFSHAFSNVGVASILALAIAGSSLDPAALWLAAIASLATAAADTTASEIGQLFGRRTFLPLSFRPVPVGTEGAISLEGTLAGAAVAVGIGVAAVWLVPFEVSPARVAGTIAGAAIAGSYLESIVGSWNRQRPDRVPNGALNFFNTLVGAVLAFAISLR